jgi:hypothetical protein
MGNTFSWLSLAWSFRFVDELQGKPEGLLRPSWEFKFNVRLLAFAWTRSSMLAEAAVHIVDGEVARSLIGAHAFIFDASVHIVGSCSVRVAQNRSSFSSPQPRALRAFCVVDSAAGRPAA